jgi:aminopeptidase N
VQTDTDGSLLWHWKEEHQIATYLMSVTASRFTISTLPFARGPNDTIPLHYVVWEEDSAQCAAFLPTVHEMMTAFSALFGPYPFDQYGMAAVTPFAFGGMEHQTMTTLHRAYRTNDGVVVHELAHQWWGDLVTCGTWRDIWLNESFATYGEALWAEWQGGATALKEDMTRKLTFQYGSWEGAIYDPVAQGFSLFANSVYSKGAWVLHTLRGVLGDTLFYRMLATYRQKFAERTAITDDLRAVVDSLTGESYAWFFDQWVYGRGWPQYALQFGSSVDTLEVTIYQLQPSSWPTYRMPIQLRLQGATQETTLVVWNSQRTESFRLPSPFPVLSVDLDPDGWILKELRDPPLAVDATTQPAGFRLLQNYPNPFNPTTVIRYELPSSHHVQLAVYDLLGREVARLVDEDQSRGSYAVQFGGDGLAAGLYLYKIRATPLEGNANGEYSAARKMVLVK